VPRPYYDESPQIHPLGRGIVSNAYMLYGFTQILSSTLSMTSSTRALPFSKPVSSGPPVWSAFGPHLVEGWRKKRRAKVDCWLAERFLRHLQ
jgi:hypothetical protein